jgi:hypothetical protein
MSPAVLTSLPNAPGGSGFALTVISLLLSAIVAMFVAWCKYRGADYVRARAELLRAGNEPKIKSLELAASLLLADPARAAAPASGPAATGPADDAKPPPPMPAEQAVAPPDKTNESRMGPGWWDLSPAVASCSLREIRVPVEAAAEDPCLTPIC